MHYSDLEAVHPAKRERPGCIAHLYAHKAEWEDLQDMIQEHAPAEIVGIEPVFILPTFTIEVLCENPEASFALMIAWLAYSETSPHRPHGKEEALAWGKQFSSCVGISTDWKF
ncbi:hypothetical protein [Microvirga alba]|uniref:Uncharacterized protein n=1 Tax=Microvirga alba TaxID=2791025 RepID=A0A931FQG9_9HYPH|nr:hypothetical protein [Microvirga alba]MBF9234622.1 hypothetical protein [Microvirga alba]